MLSLRSEFKHSQFKHILKIYHIIMPSWKCQRNSRSSSDVMEYIIKEMNYWFLVFVNSCLSKISHSNPVRTFLMSTILFMSSHFCISYKLQYIFNWKLYIAKGQERQKQDKYLLIFFYQNGKLKANWKLQISLGKQAASVN